MRIDILELVNFKSYANLHLPCGAGLNLLIGENGSGKTSILEAMAIAAGAFFGGKGPKIPYAAIRIDRAQGQAFRTERAMVKAYGQVVGGTWTRTCSRDSGNDKGGEIGPAKSYGKRFLDALDDPQTNICAPLIAYYSTQRLYVDAKRSKEQRYDPLKGRKNGYLQCLEENAIKGVLEDWMGKAVTNRATQQIKGVTAGPNLVLENVEKAIEQVMKVLMDLPEDASVKIYKDAEHDELFMQLGDALPLPLSCYSDGFRNVIFLVMDMFWRASQLNPSLDFDALRQRIQGVVMIDEVDLHLHPRWQGKILGLLVTLLPEVQFFVTTHSPSVISSFNPRDGKDVLYVLSGQDVAKLDQDYYGREVGSIVRTLMGGTDRAAAVSEQMGRFQKKLQELIDLDDETAAADRQQALVVELKQIAADLQEAVGGEDAENARIQQIAAGL